MFDHLDSESKLWTDDLEVCNQTGGGYATNQKYREDGNRSNESKFRDRSFHIKVDENTFLYAICSGHNGSKVAHLAIQRIAAEIAFGGLSGKSSEEEVKEVLRQTFLAVEKTYLETIDALLARKAFRQYEIPEGISQYEISQKYQHILDELKQINEELSVGTSVVIALICHKKLYIANIGNCRALLCKSDANNVLRVVQLSVDHNLYNEDEILRLCQLGLDPQALRQAPLSCTRCIGSYMNKTGYRDCDFLSGASGEPVISQPEIVGAIPMDDTCSFLILMSSGMCKTLQEIFSSEVTQVNKEMIQMAVEQFRTQSTMSGVAQSVVHKIVQFHHDLYMEHVQEREREDSPLPFTRRDDITLLIRNFNFVMPKRGTVRFNSVVREHSANNSIIFTDTNTLSSTNTSQYMNTNSSTSSYSSQGSRYRREQEKIPPYVDFSEYYRSVEEAKKTGQLPPGIDFD
uniref:Putative tgf-beta-activated kinase 1 and map3k7-binding protein 1-like isoform x1 n=1 Tax=Lutzomyia longipalpis TaxID=7200 RepID=A0A1B0GHI4_LUTLO